MDPGVTGVAPVGWAENGPEASLFPDKIQASRPSG